MTHTYAIGERYIDASHYVDGLASGDGSTMYSGFGNHLYRSTNFDASVTPSPYSIRLPYRDERGLDLNEHFGSAHASGFYISMCDGSVGFVSYDIEGNVHSQRGNRHDWQH